MKFELFQRLLKKHRVYEKSVCIGREEIRRKKEEIRGRGKRGEKEIS